MTKFQYLERVVQWVKTLQLESKGSRFKLHLALSWAFYNCYLVVPRPTPTDSLTNPMFIKMFSTITTKPHYKAPGDLRVKIVTMQCLLQCLWPWGSQIAVLKKISHLLSSSIYQTKCVFKCLFSQLMVSQTFRN